MKNNFCVYNAAGEIVRVGCVPVDQIDMQPVPDGCFIFHGEAAFTDMIDVTGRALRPGAKGVSPSANYDWDSTTDTWVPNLDRAKVSKKAAVEAERDRRICDVIIYGSANLDADPLSLDRLGKKITCVDIQIAQGTTPDASTLVWRDHDNVMHSFADLASYQSWLRGLAIAIDQRAMAAWAWSWQTKATVDAAATLADIDAISLS